MFCGASVQVKHDEEHRVQVEDTPIPPKSEPNMIDILVTDPHDKTRKLTYAESRMLYG